MPDADIRRPVPRFEQAAIEELERLRGEIDASRAQREAATARFEAMLRAFDAPVPASSTDPAPARSVREAAEGPRGGRVPLAAPAERRSVRQTTASRGQGVRAGSAAAIAIAALAAVLYLVMPRGEEGAAADAVAMSAPPAAAVIDETPAPAAPVPPPAELTMERQVWVRITVDGERMIEREVAAGTRVPLESGGTISVRAGDGGAVRLWLRGEDQGVLGVDGAVVTRTFTVE